ncbi:cytochrome c oxidase assembly protein [Rhizobium helianthi]|uniref:Cytochrome c oxidase assembly protein n=1 Tax=Rhizobium helianthi TaxID=1132695 RepID=A0ABW4M745_9HYPH
MRFRKACLILGCLVLAAAWITLILGNKESFSIHMIVHMAVVAGAAPLLAAGLAGGRCDFVSRGRVLTPLLASMIELVVVWGWHSPAARDLAAGSALVRGLEQLSFLLAGLILWLSCLGGAGDEKESRRLAGTLGLLFTSMHMTLLGALLSLSPRPLYGDGEVTCFGVPLSAGQDQQIGAVVMLLIGAAVYLAGGVALLGRTLNPSTARVSGE